MDEEAEDNGDRDDAQDVQRELGRPFARRIVLVDCFVDS